jgi:membrane protein
MTRRKFLKKLTPSIFKPFRLFYRASLDTIQQDGVEHAGYLAFLSILSLFPFLIFLFSVIGYFGASEQGIEIINALFSSAPKEMKEALSPRIQEIISGPPQSFLTIAIIGIIWTASSAVEGCRTILNRAYRVYSPPPYLWRRMFSILEFFVITFILIAGVFIFILIPVFLKKIESNFAISFLIDYDWFYFRQIAIFLILVFANALIYFAIPNVKQKFPQTIPGALLTVFLWIFLERLFSFYLDHFHQFNLVYGSLAGLIVALLFFYLIALAFIVGAEFNYHWKESRDKKKDKK